MKLEGCTALITGASAGIGREFARILASSAQRLVLVARREPRLEELRQELKAKHPALEIDLRVVDLSDRAQLRSLTEQLANRNIEPDVLINNAGLGDLGSLVTADPDRLEQIVLVNMNALTLLTRAALPGMIARNRGAILNVSSCAGFLPIPGFAVYAASKAYVTSFSEAIRAELRSTNVTVSALCPGPVHTEFTEVAQNGRPNHYPGPEWVHVPAEQVVRIGLAAIERDQPAVIPGAVMKIAMFVTRLTPMPLFRMLWRLGAKRD
jgi:short-subunit dehydrogenase